MVANFAEDFGLEFGGLAEAGDRGWPLTQGFVDRLQVALPVGPRVEASERTGHFAMARLRSFLALHESGRGEGVDPVATAAPRPAPAR